MALQSSVSVFNDLARPGTGAICLAINRIAVYEESSRTGPTLFVLEECFVGAPQMGVGRPCWIR